MTQQSYLWVYSQQPGRGSERHLTLIFQQHYSQQSTVKQPSVMASGGWTGGKHNVVYVQGAVVRLEANSDPSTTWVNCKDMMLRE